MRITVGRWGNSIGIHVPSPIVDEAGLRVGEELDILYNGAKKTIEISKPDYSKDEMSVRTFVSHLPSGTHVKILDGINQIVGEWTSDSPELSQYYSDMIDKLSFMNCDGLVIMKLHTVYVWAVEHSILHRHNTLTKLFDCDKQKEAQQLAKELNEKYGRYSAVYKGVSKETYDRFAEHDGWSDFAIWIVYDGNEDVAQFDSEEEALSHADSLNKAYGVTSYRVRLVPEYWLD